MSDNGRVLASFVEDALAGTIQSAGFTTREQRMPNTARPITRRCEMTRLRSGQENLAIELIRSGFSMRDFHPNVNLFSKIYCDDKEA